MADPVSLGAISIGLSAGGSLASAFGAQSKGKAAQQMYNYQAGIADFRKKIALQNRDYALQVGESQAQRYGLKAAATQATTRAVEGASGIDVGSGSKAAVIKSEQKVAAMDMATIRNNAARTAYGYMVEATGEEAQAGLYRLAGTNARKAGNIDMASSLISGATSVASKWYQGSSAGLFGPSSGGGYDLVSDSTPGWESA